MAAYPPDDEEFDQTKMDADKLTLQTGQHVDELFNHMSLDERRHSQREALRKLKRAKQIFYEIKQYLDPNFQPPIGEVDNDEDEDQSQEDSYSTEDSDEEEQEDNAIPPKTALRWWAKCLKVIQELMEKHFGELFLEVAYFLEHFFRDKDIIQKELDTRVETGEVEKLLKKASRHLKRWETLTRASKPNSHSIERALETLQSDLLILETMYGNSSEAQKFLNHAKTVMQGAASVQRSEKAHKDSEKYIRYIQNLKKEVAQASFQLNQKLSKQMDQTKRFADHEITTFPKKKN